MTVIYQIYLALGLILLSSHNSLAAGATDENCQIMSALKDQYEYCSAPHTKVFNIYHLLSKGSHGIVTNHDSVSYLLHGNAEFKPEKIVLQMCENNCRHMKTREDLVKLECEFVPEKVIRWFNITHVGGYSQYHKLDFVQHSKCICNFNEFESEKTESPYQCSSGKRNSEIILFLYLFSIIMSLIIYI